MGFLTPPRKKDGSKMSLSKLFKRKSGRRDKDSSFVSSSTSSPRTPGLVDLSMDSGYSQQHQDPPGIDRTSGIPRVRSQATPPRTKAVHTVPHGLRPSRTDPSSKLPLSDDPDERDILKQEEVDTQMKLAREQARQALARIEMASRPRNSSPSFVEVRSDDKHVSDHRNKTDKVEAVTEIQSKPASPLRKRSIPRSSSRPQVIDAEDIHKLDCAAEVYDMMRESTGVSKTTNTASLDTDDFSISSEVEDLVADTTYFCTFFGDAMADTCRKFQKGQS